MTALERAATAAYLSGDVVQSLVHRLEERHGLTLSAETRAVLHQQLRPIVEPIVLQALDQEAAIHV